MELNKTRKNVFAVFYFSILCFIVLLTGAYLNLRKSDQETSKLKKAMLELSQFQNVYIDIQSIESGQRGFVISGNKAFLNEYHSGLSRIKQDTVFITQYFSDPTLLKEKKKELLRLINNKIIYSNKIVALRSIYGDDSTDALIAKKQGLMIMDSIITSLQFFTNHQLSIIKTYSIENESLIKKGIYNYLLLLVILAFASIITFLSFNKGFIFQAKSEEKLRFNNALLSNLYDPVVTTDNNFNITSWNKNAEILFGYTEEEVLGKRLKEVLKTKSENNTVEEIREIIKSKKTWNGDLVYLNIKNEILYANVSTSVIYDEENRITGTVSIIRDITESKLNEMAINKLTKNLEKEVKNKVDELTMVFERTTDAFIALDNNWNYIYINEKAAMLHHVSANEIIGKNITELTPIHSSQEFYDELIAVKKAGLYKNTELYNAKTQQWFENRMYPNENGISVYYREITNRKNSEQKLIESNKNIEALNSRFELILKSTNEAIWDLNMETNEVWGNERYLELIKNKSPEKTNFETFRERMHPDDTKAGLEIIEKCMAEKKEMMITEFRYQNGDGIWIDLLNTQRVLYASDGNPYRIIGTLQNITEQKAIQTQILHEKELSDVLINSLPGVFYMFNKNGKYLRWNKNILNITGYSEEDMKDMHPINFVPEDQRALLSEKIGNVFNFGIDNAEADLLKKNGERIAYYFTGIYLKYNGEDCMMGVGIDISEKSKYQKELKDLSIHIQNIREEERTRIAREIHDELGQQLTGLKMDISWINKKMINDKPDVIEKIKNALVLIDDTVKSVRRISTQLRPSVLDDLGLISAMEWQTDEFQKRFNIPSSFISNVATVNLHADKITAIFRIYQESLTNILRHSEATKVITSITLENDKLLMKISDNGIGFNETEIKNKKTLGLLGMKERALMLGGHYQIISKPNEGTIVLLELPLDV